ncbi:hypothetical protein PROFUN_13230 [Planoprotostelium fungivorum]|uniref:Uncharacterized protein n=1 Tax=Planoprotostelium fungivorum TaxID=1890364 RepID=A0A2P6N4Q9_9EUKA|nr:hypothetical protein PROFUN_13230 [Planoprotostelium fungivorum]
MMMCLSCVSSLRFHDFIPRRKTGGFRESSCVRLNRSTTGADDATGGAANSRTRPRTDREGVLHSMCRCETERNFLHNSEAHFKTSPSGNKEHRHLFQRRHASHETAPSMPEGYQPAVYGPKPTLPFYPDPIQPQLQPEVHVAPAIPSRIVSEESKTVSTRGPSSELLPATHVTCEREVQLVEKPTVVREHIHNVEKEEIQPIIHREVEQTEVHQITQKLHETEVKPTIVQHLELAPQIRAPLIIESEPVPSDVILASTTTSQKLKTTETLEPIVKERIRKIIVEEVQPVVDRDMVHVTIVKQTLPLYISDAYLDRELTPARPLRDFSTGMQFSGGILRDYRKQQTVDNRFNNVKEVKEMQTRVHRQLPMTSA